VRNDHVEVVRLMQSHRGKVMEDGQVRPPVAGCRLWLLVVAILVMEGRLDGFVWVVVVAVAVALWLCWGLVTPD